MTKHQVMSLAILALVKEGMTTLDAMRAVLGAELVDEMIGEVYATLRASGYQARLVAGQAVR